MRWNPLRHVFCAAVLLSVLGVGPVSAAPADGPEITDPEGDAVHREFGWDEPTLDVTEVTFNWTDYGRLEISVLLPNADELGPEGTMDPASPGVQETYVDVYWSMHGEDYLARARWAEGEEAEFSAGQGIRIHRQVFWEEHDHIHGETSLQEGRVEPEGDGHRVFIVVDPASVGSPGPGDLLEAPAFSSYIDHHFPVFEEDWPLPHPVGPHHPANADVNDTPGLHFHVPGNGTGDEAGPASAGDAEQAPAIGLLWVVGALAGLVVLVRRR